MQCLIQLDVTNEKSDIIFVSEKISEMGAETIKGTGQSRLLHQNLMQVGVYLDQEIHSNIDCDQAHNLHQTLVNIIIFILINIYIQFGDDD